jgi:hypothetical protein
MIQGSFPLYLGHCVSIIMSFPIGFRIVIVSPLQVLFCSLRCSIKEKTTITNANSGITTRGCRKAYLRKSQFLLFVMGCFCHGKCLTSFSNKENFLKFMDFYAKDYVCRCRYSIFCQEYVANSVLV